MTGFRFRNGILEYYLWTKYARLDLERCDGEKENSGWLFQLGGDTRSHSKTYFADGVVRLGDEYYLFEVRQDAAAPLDAYDAATGIITGRLWKLQGNIKALSVLGFDAQ
jgi:hypothetical protein